ncbi:RloB family protein [Algoriphagus resistens]|uniref:RloB family protein n=1 Tax=Algoriphagus resistens TaxID=1750590 RepID=UPI0007167DDF|nr:RloB family protein [Algoriphagus resistens]
MHKKRGYKRDTPIELVRDYKLFAIACEGGKREPEYFKTLEYLSRKIKVDIIEEKVTDEELIPKLGTKSAPKWVLQRVVTYIEQEGLIDEDQLWIVMDVDRWKKEQLREIAMYCDQHPNWHIVLSNPCFEVWLYFHKKGNIKDSGSMSCNDFKNEISKLEKGGYHPFKFISSLSDAIKNAKAADSDIKHFIPNEKETKIYQLGESILKVVGKNEFNEFLSKTLPSLIQAEADKIKQFSKNRGKKPSANN